MKIFHEYISGIMAQNTIKIEPNDNIVNDESYGTIKVEINDEIDTTSTSYDKFVIETDVCKDETYQTYEQWDTSAYKTEKTHVHEIIAANSSCVPASDPTELSESYTSVKVEINDDSDTTSTYSGYNLGDTDKMIPTNYSNLPARNNPDPHGTVKLELDDNTETTTAEYETFDIETDLCKHENRYNIKRYDATSYNTKIVAKHDETDNQSQNMDVDSSHLSGEVLNMDFPTYYQQQVVHDAEESVYIPCKYTTSNRPSMESHKISIQSKENEVRLCKHCEYWSTDEDNMKQHITAQHKNLKSYICKQYGWSTNRTGSLITHPTARHSREKVHKCLHCEYSCNQAGNLNSHIMSRHTKEKPHKCSHCEYSCNQAGNLKKHIKSLHTSEKPYSCPHCEYSCKRADTLNDHIMSRHTKEKPHECSHCEYSCSRANTLKNHIIARHTREKPRKCLYCEYSCTQVCDLKHHVVEQHTGEKPYKCSHCEYSSTRASDLRSHTMTRHT